MRTGQATKMDHHPEGAANPQDEVPAYEPDDEAVTPLELAWLRARAAGELPTGGVIHRASLFSPTEGC